MMKTILYFLMILLISSCGCLDSPKIDKFDDDGRIILSYTLKSKKELMEYKILHISQKKIISIP